MSNGMNKVNGPTEMPPQMVAGNLGLFSGHKRPEILIKLKTETDTLHHKLQVNKVFEGLFTSTPSVNRYIELLKKFLGFYSILEANIACTKELNELGFDFEERRKTHFIEKDLRILGLTEDELLNLPKCSDLPRVSTLGEALGCIYVLEGATLGAQQLARNLNQALGMNENNGCAFLKCYGDKVGPMFKAFGDFLDSNSSKYNHEEAIADAKQTFILLDKWLTG